MMRADEAKSSFYIKILKSMTPEEIVKQLVRDMNAAWIEGRVEELGRFFAPDVVFVAPDGNNRITGREAAVESFRQYTEQAVTHRFDEVDLQVDVTGAIAVASLRFNVRYEFAGAMYEETGRDILVLASPETGWHIAWRTQITGEVKNES